MTGELGTIVASMGNEPAAQPAAQPAPAPAAPTPAAPPAAEPTKTPQEVFSQTQPIANKAFAEMRVQNARFKSVLGRLGGMVGVQDSSDPESLVGAIESRIRDYEAQKSNVPAELLQRVDNMDAFFQQYQQEQLHSAALIGFQKVKETYGLTDADLTSFAQQLDESGLNPFQSQVDLIQQYRMLNYEKLVQKEVDKAVQAALGISKNTAATSTTPARVATPDTQEPPKSTMQELKALLRDYKV